MNIKQDTKSSLSPFFEDVGAGEEVGDNVDEEISEKALPSRLSKSDVSCPMPSTEHIIFTPGLVMLGHDKYSKHDGNIGFRDVSLGVSVHPRICVEYECQFSTPSNPGAAG